jgi:transcriptional regulator with XRE-family HTH domain
MERTIHHGRNVKRFREMLGIKQETLAFELGDDWSQRRISLLEGKDVIESESLEKIADALKVPADAIRNFDEEAAVNIIANTFHKEVNAFNKNYHCTFNPIDKIVQLYDEKIELYERLLRNKDEVITALNTE